MDEIKAVGERIKTFHSHPTLKLEEEGLKTPITLVVTNQMALQLFDQDGSRSNFSSNSAIAKLVPQVQGNPTSRNQGQRGVKDEEGEEVRSEITELEDSAGEYGSVLGKETWRVMIFRVESGHR